MNKEFDYVATITYHVSLITVIYKHLVEFLEKTNMGRGTEQLSNQPINQFGTDFQVRKFSENQEKGCKVKEIVSNQVCQSQESHELHDQGQILQVFSHPLVCTPCEVHKLPSQPTQALKAAPKGKILRP